MKTISDWKAYEQAIYQMIRQMMGVSDDFVQILPDAKLIGKRSGVPRQIDILVKVDLGPIELAVVVDCKSYKRRIDVKGVDEFIGIVQDVGASKGILVTTVGYTPAAVKRAGNDSSDIDLVTTKQQQWHEYNAFFAMPFLGRHGIFLAAPPGWVLDTRSNYQDEPARMGDVEFPRGLAFLHPIEKEFETAFRRDCFIYCNISTGCTIEDLIEEQRKNYPGVEPEISEYFFNGEKFQSRRYTLREFDVIEETRFRQCGSFIFWAVLLAPLSRKGRTSLAVGALTKLVGCAEPVPSDLVAGIVSHGDAEG